MFILQYYYYIKLFEKYIFIFSQAALVNKEEKDTDFNVQHTAHS